uniref:G-protein coupled receptors family 1 profile domain-containing protein n=1 Tax=Anabas testudineus TaxID=64144 RepID=A0A3Q1JKR9_ANATE
MSFGPESCQTSAASGLFHTVLYLNMWLGDNKHSSYYNCCVSFCFSRFRQLHTNTNLLVLSLAVADFLVGLLQMPIEIILNQGCWLLSDFMCTVNAFLSYFLVSVSVGNLVLISVDRYVAICDPMFYYTKVTLNRVQICICLCWVFSAVHSSWILRDFAVVNTGTDYHKSLSKTTHHRNRNGTTGSFPTLFKQAQITPFHKETYSQPFSCGALQT